MRILQELVALEAQHPALWEAEACGMHLWPLLRNYLMTTVIGERRGHTPSWQMNKSDYLAPQAWADHARTLAFLAAPGRREKAAALFFKNVATLYLEAETGRVFDRLYEPYYEQVQTPLIFEEGRAYPAHRRQPYARNVLATGTLFLWAYGQAVARRFPLRVRRRVSDFAAWVTALFGTHQEPSFWTGRMTTFLKMYLALRPVIARRVVPRLSSRLAFVHSASYMGIRAVFVRALREAGCTVAEVQHGVLADSAYLLPEGCLQESHPARLYLPDVLLTFGDYWSRLARTPSRCVSVGYPYFNDMVQRLERHTPATPRQILILSQGTVTERLVALTERLAAALPDHTLVYKLHPHEVDFRERYQALYGLPNVRVAAHVNVYELIAGSGIIVGYNSMALFEARAFAGKRVFVLENDDIPADLGAHFHTAEALLDLLDEPQRRVVTFSPGAFWAQDSRARIAAFLREALA